MAHTNNKRNNCNTNNVNVRTLPSSGFDLSHKSKDSLRIGRRELISYEFVMSGDNTRLSTAHDLQFMPTTANMLPAMDIRVEHTFVPFRNVNMDYKDTLTYQKGNPIEASVYPTFTIQDLYKSGGPLDISNLSIEDDPISDVSNITSESAAQLYFEGFVSDLLSAYLIPAQLADYEYELKRHIGYEVAGWANLTSTAKLDVAKKLSYDLVVADICGEGSYLDKLNAPIIGRFQYYDAFDASVTAGDKWKHLFSGLIANYSCPISEMAVRALFADWFETTRDSNLEPASSFPRYERWTNARMSNAHLMLCLLPRFSTFGRDIWTTANIDSPYRHVIAPVEQTTYALSSIGSDIQGVLEVASKYNGTSKYTIPNNYGVVGNGMASQTISGVQGIDLVALKRAGMAKDWLMRGHIFGDEYQDYILAQYGVKLSEGRINKPLYLGGYSTEVNIDTTVNPTATTVMPAGAKNCTMNSSGQDNQTFDFFSEENGIVLTWAWIAPAVTYQPYDIRHGILKGIDFPTPVFANDSEELSCVGELDRNYDSVSQTRWRTPFGRHPYAHAWRGRVDENHSDFLFDLKPQTFLREFDTSAAVSLNYAFIHCHVALPFMVDVDPLNRLAFGTFNHKYYVTRKLPIVTDFC